MDIVDGLTSRVAQWLLESELRENNRNLLPGRAIRRGATALGFPKPKVLVHYRLHSYDLVLPFDHALPRIKKQAPLYSENIGRLSRYLDTLYPGLAMIDIGANVGDSAAIIRSYGAGGPILCIEGSPTYFALPQRNKEVNALALSLECSFVDCQSGKCDGTLRIEKGTAALSQERGSLTSARSLVDILNSWPEFKYARLLKLDTDGFDNRIIAGSAPWLAKTRPWLFWEFDPVLDRQHRGPGTSVFQTLADCGYGPLALYANTGEFLCSASVESHEWLCDVSAFLSYQRNLPYVDICAAPKSDTCEFLNFCAAEREFFRGRPGLGLSRECQGAVTTRTAKQEGPARGADVG
jgi:FkbM family methyltransferase